MANIGKKTGKTEKQPSPAAAAAAKTGKLAAEDEKISYAKEYWTGDSRDGGLVNGDGYHFYRLKGAGLITEAYEVYETDDGQEVASPLPEMINVDWVADLGFDEGEALEDIPAEEFERVRGLALKS